MYARTTYPSTEDSLSIPQNYRGIALHTEHPQTPQESDTTTTAAPSEPCTVTSGEGKHPWEIPPPPPPPPPKESPFSLGSLLGRFPFFSSHALGGAPFPLLEKAQGIGKSLLDGNVENLLLIGLAIFLFLSDSGDKTCALILLALLIFT